jgi:hypothetical protein
MTYTLEDYRTAVDACVDDILELGLEPVEVVGGSQWTFTPHLARKIVSEIYKTDGELLIAAGLTMLMTVVLELNTRKNGLL